MARHAKSLLIGTTKEVSAVGRSGRAPAIALVLALILAAGAAACRRERLDSGPAAKSWSAEPQLVSFSTPDGGLVHAHQYGEGDQGVVLAHGGRFDKESWASQARTLAQAGFRVLAIDFRGYGESRGGSRSKDPYDGLYLDVLAAVAYLRQTDAGSVSVVGGSMGGGAAAEAAVAAEPGEIDRLVLLAHSPIEHPERMQGRKLFITCRDDLNGDGSPRLTRIREQYEQAPEPKELVILEGSAHAQYIFGTDQGERLMQEILRFLSAP